jgi:hypothetical protein
MLPKTLLVRFPYVTSYPRVGQLVMTGCALVTAVDPYDTFHLLSQGDPSHQGCLAQSLRQRAAEASRSHDMPML